MNVRIGRAIVALSLVAAPAAAEGPGARLHDGFMLRLAVGGVAHESTLAHAGQPAGSELHRASGLGTGYAVTAGGTVARGLVVAGELTSHAIANPETTPGRGSPLAVRSASYSGLLAVGDFYPNPRGGFHAMVGAGMGTLSYQFPDDPKDADPRSRYGLGWMVGAGWDRFISDQWSLGVVGRFDACLASDRSRDDDKSGPNFHAAARAVTLSVAATYH